MPDKPLASPPPEEKRPEARTPKPPRSAADTAPALAARDANATHRREMAKADADHKRDVALKELVHKQGLESKVDDHRRRLDFVMIGIAVAAGVGSVIVGLLPSMEPDIKKLVIGSLGSLMTASLGFLAGRATGKN